MTGKTAHHMTQEDKEHIAQEKFGASYDELELNEKKAVGSAFGHNPVHHTEAHEPAHEHEHMSQEDKERISQEKYGMAYEQLKTNQKRAVAGLFGGEVKERMAEGTH